MQRQAPLAGQGRVEIAANAADMLDLDQWMRRFRHELVEDRIDNDPNRQRLDRSLERFCRSHPTFLLVWVHRVRSSIDSQLRGSMTASLSHLRSSCRKEYRSEARDSGTPPGEETPILIGNRRFQCGFSSAGAEFEPEADIFAP